MKRENKSKKIEEIIKLLQENTSLVVFSYGKTTHQALEKVRRGIEGLGGRIKVIKNTFFKKALNKTKKDKKILVELKKEINNLKGNTALILFQNKWDKILIEFNKLIKGNDEFAYKAAIIENTVYPQEKIRYIANLPAKEVILGRIIGGIKSPLYKLTNSLRYNTAKFVYILKAKGGENK